MDIHKLKIKVGDHEFEAEGPTEVVQAQFAAFRELVSNLPPRVPPVTPPIPPGGPTPPANGNLSLDKITKQEGRVVSLTARCASIEDEILLVLYGQKVLRENDGVTGGEVLNGLRLTGRTNNRVDYQLDKLTNGGDVITVGVGRARRYRLTNQGFARADMLARSILASLP